MESFISIKDTPVESPVITSDSLLSMERLDRSSPELWPEQIPGMQDYTTRPTPSRAPEWKNRFNAEDNKLLFTLSKMSATSLVAEVKRLYEAAYQLGCEESKEMTRGMYLKVLTKKPKKEGENVP